jgi:hypothetical protein
MVIKSLLELRARSGHHHEAADMPFVYCPFTSPTPEIRLLTVAAGNWDDPVVCTLRHHHLDDASKLQYEAVSYCWGDFDKCSLIVLNEEEFLVTKNAFGAIRNLRMPDKARRLWVDLICIDQNNDDEKGYQVALMGQIYSNALRTLIWLGDDDDGTVGEAVITMDALVAEMRASTNDFDEDTMRDMSIGIHGAGSSAIREWPYPARTKAFVQLLQRPWFTRVWVIQEAILPPETICVIGDHIFDWVDLGRAVVWLEFKDGEIGPEDIPPQYRRGLKLAAKLYKKVDHRRTKSSKRVPRPDLCDILQNVAGFDVSNQRDRVYGILGLMDWSEQEGTFPERLRPDYTKPVLLVYRDAIKFIIEDRLDLNIISADFGGEADIFSPERANIPTWIPRWDKKLTENDVDQIPWWIFEANTEKLQLPTTWNQSSNSLFIPGHVIDRIVTVSSVITLQSLRTAEGRRRTLTEVWQLMSTSDRYTDSTRMRTLALTMVAGMIKRVRADTYNELERSFCCFLRTNDLLVPDESGRLAMEQQSDQDDVTIKAREFEESMVMALKSRRFFVTSTGFVGIGLPLIESGDLMCVLQSGKVPYVLRPVGSHFKFVQACYCPGIMFGEVRKSLNTVFEIR